MLNRYIRTIQIQRQDFNGRMLTTRKDDVRAIACILGVATERTLDRLDQLGLCRAGVLEPSRPARRHMSTVLSGGAHASPGHVGTGTVPARQRTCHYQPTHKPTP